MAVPPRLVIVTRVRIKSRCPKWRTTVDLIRCKALDCTICWLDDDTVVVLRHTVVECRSFGSLNHKNITKLYSERKNANKPQKKHIKQWYKYQYPQPESPCVHQKYIIAWLDRIHTKKSSINFIRYNRQHVYKKNTWTRAHVHKEHQEI